MYPYVIMSAKTRRSGQLTAAGVHAELTRAPRADVYDSASELTIFFATAARSTAPRDAHPHDHHLHDLP